MAARRPLLLSDYCPEKLATKNLTGLTDFFHPGTENQDLDGSRWLLVNTHLLDGREIVSLTK